MAKVILSAVRTRGFLQRNLMCSLTAITLAGISLTGCNVQPPAEQPRTTACSADDADGPAATVFAATATSAEPRPDVPTASLAGLKAAAAKELPACAVVVPPRGAVISFDITARRPDASVEHGEGRERLITANLDQVQAAVRGLKATEPGLDPIAMITRVVRLHPTPASLVLVTTGISTAEPVDLRRLGWDFDIPTVVRALASDGQLPDLTGWTVQILGVGDSGGKQKRPALPQQTRLRAFWKQLCIQAQARRCSVPDVIVGETYSMATNVVPIVELPRPEIHAGSATFPGALFGIDSAHIGPDIDAALKVVVAQALTTGSRLVVIGRTDAITGTVEHNYQLSYARAEAIAMWLIKLGLPPRQVTFSGVGGADASATAELADPAVVARDRRVDITFEKQPRFQ